ncbi:MAG TPA: coenzyme F420-0:L-glutamate ligase, partial [Anaerolineaceae bacterium]|nr:coenzyme F420-0:L-glutamate ligase [Anaerolineaceae bacterium]
MTKPKQLSYYALEGIPQIKAGDPLAQIIHAAVKENGLSLQDGDVLILAQKIVSKAEDRLV